MSLKVLIADADWRFCRQATAYLESHAHLVVRHTQAEPAWQAVQHWQPDLVMLSEELACTGFLEALHSLKDRPAVLLLGRLDRYDKAWRAWQLGGDELLMKPVFKAEELHEAVVAALENAATGVRHQPLAASA